MAIDPDTLSKNDLEKLKADVEKALGKAEAKRKADALKALEKTAKQHGFALSDLVGEQPKSAKGAAKYRNPADGSQTWTGRGRKPNWLIAALKAGTSLEQMAI